MNAVVILWAGVAGTALTLAGVHGTLWLLDRRGLANLVFCFVCLGVAGFAIAELGMMESLTGAEYSDWVRAFHVANIFAVLGLVVFVRLQFGAGRTWLAAVIFGLRLYLLVVNFASAGNATWSEISTVRTIQFLGEPVSVIGNATLRPTQWVGTLASLLFIVYVADALATVWRRGEGTMRRKALVICGGILAFIVLAILESQLVIWKVIQMPVVVAPPFLILVAAITYELSRDIVASVRKEREAQRLRDELAHVARVSMVSQLSSSLAHELRQPLTSILANTQAAQLLLKAGKVDVAELRAILEDIQTDDLRADAIIERTRALMKQGSLELRDVSIAAATKDVLTILRTDAIKRNVEIESSIPEALASVRADRVQLSQVLLNLIANAMDAVSANGSSQRKVRIEARPDGGNAVEVAVVDSGNGIASEVFPRIFDAFVTTKPTGLGIGLAVSRAIIEAHGGRIWAENNHGSGATFRFTLQTA